MPNVSRDIVLNNFQECIADSPETGFADMRNMDPFSQPGTIRAKLRTNKDSSTTVTDLIKWIVTDPATGYRYALGDAGKVYTNSSGSWAVIAGNTTSSAAGNGLAIWKGYLFVARNAALDVYGPLSGGAAWSNGWQTWSGSEQDDSFHPMLVAQDDMLYIGAGRYVSSIAETSGSTFAPGTGATYTWNSQALDLPNKYRVKCMEELGTLLMIGTWQGTNVYDVKIADIFPWNRTDTSFGLPIRLNEFGVHQMKNINNVLWLTAGLQGSVYTTNGSTTVLMRKLPLYTRNVETAYFQFYPGAATQKDDRYMFGVSRGTGASTIPAQGVYSVSSDRKLVLENEISSAPSSLTNAFAIGALNMSGSESLYIGWQDNTTYGIDLTDTTNRYGSYAAYFDSALFPTGTPKAKRKFRRLQIQLDRDMASGSGVRVQYRTKLSDSFTTIDTIDFATYGAISSYSSGVSIGSVENIQLRIGITQAASNLFALKEVRLI